MSTTDREQQARDHLDQSGAISTGPDGDDNVAMLLAFVDSPDAQRSAGLVRLNDVIAILENSFTCRACDTFFLSPPGHYDEDCPKGRSSWDGASDEQKLAAIRALATA